MFSRRSFLANTALAAAGTAFGRAQQPTAEVTTPLGTVRGTVNASGIRSFKGVPFAQAPIGPLRWHAPHPLKPWSGTLDATRFAAIAMQGEERDITQSEDCLYLNIWAPSTPGPHPVFVWIHGGGFVSGRSFGGVFDGTSFAENGIICINIAYRLGIFGFLDLEPALGPTFADSANNALRDAIAALEWVQQNIASFGGDPARVTVGGQSAGAKLTDILLGTSAARPLFHQAISESGGADRVDDSATSAALAQAFAATTTLTPTADARTLIDAQTAFLKTWPRHFPLRPAWSTRPSALLPQPPLEAIRAGSSKGKRLLIGTNHDESAAFIGPHPDHDPVAKDLGNMTLAQFAPIEAAYKQRYPDMAADLRRIREVTAEEYLMPSLQVAAAHAHNGGDTFVYRFDLTAATGRYAGLAAHSAELRYTWNNLTLEVDSSTRALAAQIHAAWCAFISGTDPSGWPKWTPSTQSTMLLNATSTVANAPTADELALWKLNL